MQILNINGKAISLYYPKGFEYTEIKPFNQSRPKKFKLYEKQRGKTTYYLPRVYILPKENKDNIEIPDFLYDKQKEAVKKLLQYNYGIMLSGVGSGKSYMIGAISQAYAGHTLIIVPKKEIAKGIKEKLDKLGIESERFNSKKFSIENPPKILIMVQKSFNMYWETLSLDKVYKQILIDEIHLENTKNRIHFLIHYKYEKIYGFTGTPELNNFPKEALFKMFNNVYVDSGIRPKEPTIYTLHFKSKSKYLAEDRIELVETMYWDIERLCKFVSLVVEVMNKKDRTMGIVFIDRKDIAEALAFLISECGIPAKSYTGKLSNKKRQEVLQHLTDVRGVMVATYQTVGTGFDYPPLDTAFYFMFVKFKAQVKQAVGRILRGAKNPEYYDFQDSNLWKQVSSRLQAYKEMRPNSRIYKYDLKNEVKLLKCLTLKYKILSFKKEKDKEFLLI